MVDTLLAGIIFNQVREVRLPSVLQRVLARCGSRRVRVRHHLREKEHSQNYIAAPEPAMLEVRVFRWQFHPYIFGYQNCLYLIW